MQEIIFKIDWVKIIGSKNFELNIYPYSLPLNDKLKNKLNKIVKEKFNKIQQCKIKIDQIEFNYYMFYFKTILNLKIVNNDYEFIKKTYSSIEEFTEDINSIKLYEDINPYYYFYYKIVDNPKLIDIPEVRFIINNNDRLKIKFDYLLNAQKFDLI